ncbi:TPA: hypothetical protein ACJGQJ_004607 [Salmonella enterica subsp. enterica serovar Mgulani]
MIDNPYSVVINEHGEKFFVFNQFLKKTERELIRGAKYEGKPCRRCGGVVRYMRDRQCVVCNQRKSAEQQARLKGISE